MPCITPRMRLWHSSENRHIHGIEALNFQGINYDIFGGSAVVNEKLQKYSSSLLQDLAGNAFHSGCAAAMLMSMLCSVGEALSEKERNSQPLTDSIKHLSAVAPPWVNMQMSTSEADLTLDALWVVADGGGGDNLVADDRHDDKHNDKHDGKHADVDKEGPDADSAVSDEICAEMAEEAETAEPRADSAAAEEEEEAEEAEVVEEAEDDGEGMT